MVNMSIATKYDAHSPPISAVMVPVTVDWPPPWGCTVVTLSYNSTQIVFPLLVLLSLTMS